MMGGWQGNSRVCAVLRACGAGLPGTSTRGDSLRVEDQKRRVFLVRNLRRDLLYFEVRLATFRRKIENIMLNGLNRSFCGKLQARTDLKLTVAAAVDSFV
jgi:hypothetical protein